jgi:hygromycin-B 7''-O-kinase
VPLPQDSDPVAFDLGFRLDHAAWRAAIVEVCRAHHIDSEHIVAFADGSNLVAAVHDRWIVKIFPPFHRHQWESESRVLARLRGEPLPLKVPALLASGTRDDGWPYVIMEKLPGASLTSCWGECSARERASMMEQVGAMMVAVHRLPLGELVSLPPEWRSFLRSQKAGCRQRHVALGVPDWFPDRLESLLRDWSPDEDADDLVLLTGEYTPFNLLAERGEAGWRLSGMIDFGDAMVGPREYDFLGPSMFSCGGDRALVAALLRGYFGEARPIGEPLRMRLMALAALHRYANFNVQLCIPDWRERSASFEALAAMVWPEG